MTEIENITDYIELSKLKPIKIKNKREKTMTSVQNNSKSKNIISLVDEINMIKKKYEQLEFNFNRLEKTVRYLDYSNNVNKTPKK